MSGLQDHAWTRVRKQANTGYRVLATRRADFASKLLRMLKSYGEERLSTAGRHTACYWQGQKC